MTNWIEFVEENFYRFLSLLLFSVKIILLFKKKKVLLRNLLFYLYNNLININSYICINNVILIVIIYKFIDYNFVHLFLSIESMCNGQF